jgi:hypothetical protein
LNTYIEQIKEESVDSTLAMTAPNPDGFFPDLRDENACSVSVAVRVRPFVGRELAGGK